MAECRYALITQNLVDTFNGQGIDYNGQMNTMYCERQRTKRQVKDRYPFVEIIGPTGEPKESDIHRTNVTLHYLIELRECRIDDSETDGSSRYTQAEIMQNISAEIQRLVMEDYSRGGNATYTRWGDFGDYIDYDNGEELVIYQVVEVDTQVVTVNP
jgi:hypothetical protein